jgi:hypothetical protein
MSRKWLTTFLFSFLLISAVAVSEALAQEGGLRDEQPPIPVSEIIQKFAAKEAQFRLARGNYVYRQDVKVQELDSRNRVLGEYHVISDILFESPGRRTEKIVYAPQSTLRGIQITPQDLEDIRSIQPFVLTTDDLHLYNVTYLGKELIDEIDNYVFEVSPKVIEEGERYFEGKIWVDDIDLQIVKTFGKAVPDIIKDGQENLFPRFETYREQIDGVFWFPTYTRAVDTLNFSSGSKRIRQVIKYEDYKQFGADVQLTFGDEVDEEDPETDEESPSEDPNKPTEPGAAKKKKGPGTG